ncbi:MAG: TIGR02186 family protein [Microgenomates group bacterium]
MIRAFMIAICFMAISARAETIVAGLSENRVAITANFDGSELLIYGAVKREEPSPTDFPLDVIITVEGPSQPLVIRRKEWTGGIWINRSSVKIDSAPSFYAINTTGPLEKILSGTEDLRHKITIEKAIRAVGISNEARNSPEFVEGLLRVRTGEDRYRVAEGIVQLSQETLFRTDVVLPANLTEGNYRVRIFLLRGGKVIDVSENLVGVRKAGLERFLFRLAHEQPLTYGLISLAIAAIAGWAASAGFRLLRS